MAERIHKGATRPALIKGIPLLPAIYLSLGGAIPAMWLWIVGAALKWPALNVCAALVVAAVIAALLWLRRITRKDDQRVRQWVIAAQLTLWCSNRRLWGCRSYSPIDYRKQRR